MYTQRDRQQSACVMLTLHDKQLIINMYMQV